MSVTEVIAQLRRAHALLTEARQATTQADAAITHGATVFATTTEGSAQPEVAQINRLAARSSEDVRAADALFSQTQDLIDGYCQEIAGHGIGGGSPSLVAAISDEASTRPPPTAQTHDTDRPPNPEIRYDEAIAELRRNGVKVSPEKIVRMGRAHVAILSGLRAATIRVAKPILFMENGRTTSSRRACPRIG